MTSKPTSAQLVLKISSFIFRLLLNVLFYTVVVMLIIKASKMTYEFAYEIFGQVAVSEEPGRDVEIQIKRGESTMNIASKLEFKRLIVNKYSFYVKAKLKKYNIMPGTYTLNTAMTYDDIFAIITVPSADAAESGDTKNGKTQNSKVSGDQDKKGKPTETTKDSSDTDNTN